MKTFAAVCRALELSKSSAQKADGIAQYLSSASDADIIWMLAIFSGKRPASVFSPASLKEYAMEMAGLPSWLFDECLGFTGDVSETIALILPAPSSLKSISLSEVMEVWRSMKAGDAATRKELLFSLWNSMETYERYVLNKLLTGAFRSTIPEGILCSALFHLTGIDEWKLRLRLQRNWSPDQITFQELVFKAVEKELLAKPFPWTTLTIYQAPLVELGNEDLWRVDIQPEGVRVQLIKRDGEVFIWSSTGDLITPLFPEIKQVFSESKNSFVMTGLLIAFKADKFLPIQFLEKRLKARKASKILMTEVPVVFYADDLLEWEGQDISPQPLCQRLEKLTWFVQTLNHVLLHLSHPVILNFQEENVQSTGSVFSTSCSSFLIRKLTGRYHQEGEPTYLWSPKSDPLSIIGVLIYVQSGNPGTGGFAVEFTFAVWKQELLIPVAKVRPETLSPGEMQKINDYVKGNVVEKFGPVRSIVPDLVFEIGFEKVQQSKRHKSGLILQSPRIIKWLPYEPIHRAHTLNDLLAMISG
jgi:DNA ligase-1